MIRTASPVPLSAAGHFTPNVTARVVSITRVTVTARLPGELRGSAVAIKLQIANRSSEALELGNVIVTMFDADGSPVPPTSAAPASSFSGALAAGRTARATFVFVLSRSHPNPVRIDASYSTRAAVVVFTGPIS